MNLPGYAKGKYRLQ